MRYLCSVITAILACIQFSYAQTSDEDRSESPYFVVKSMDSTATNLRMPLRHTEAEVNVAGVIADVRVRQVYQNEGDKTLEATYIFPASTRAAVYGMRMRIGKKEVEAKIKRKEKAQEMYDEAKAKGQTASLLEQHRPNVFQMSVANILPGDSIVVELSYTELLVPEKGVYEFVYPTVVGPRYVSPTHDDAESAEPFSNMVVDSAGKSPSYTFGMDIELRSGVPIQSISSPSHSISHKKLDENTVKVDLNSEEMLKGNKDFVLRYGLVGDQIETGLMTYRSKGEKFFLFMAQPPKRVEATDAPPREYVFVFDVSGSMNGFPLNVSKKLFRDLVGNLSEKERFNVVLFAGTANILSPDASLKPTEENIERAIAFLGDRSGSGGTQLLPALEKSLNLKHTPGYSRTVVIATDGYISADYKAIELIRKSMGAMNVFTFGIGSSANRYLIEGLAYVGKGEPFIALNQQEATEMAERFHEYVRAPILTDIQVNFGDMDVYDVEPLGVPDMFAERPIVMFGKYKGALNGELKVSGVNGEGVWSDSFDLKEITPREKNRAIRYLWARERIRLMDDYGLGREFGGADRPVLEDKVAELGLKYNLLTSQTSFIAIYKKKRVDAGEADSTVNQVLPRAEGVSDYAGLGQTLTTANMVPLQASSANYTLASVSITAEALGGISRNTTSGNYMVDGMMSLFDGMQQDLFDNELGRKGQPYVDGMYVNGGLGRNSFMSNPPINLFEAVHYQVYDLDPIMGYGDLYGRVNFEVWNPYFVNEKWRAIAGIEGDQYGGIGLHVGGMHRIHRGLRTRLLVNANWMPRTIDRNGDSFVDAPMGHGLTAFHDWHYHSGKDWGSFAVEGGLSVVYNDAEYGQVEATRIDSLSFFRARRDQLNAGAWVKSWIDIHKSHRIRIRASGNFHRQSAGVGLTGYFEGEEESARIGVDYTYDPRGKSHEYTVGGGYTWADYSDLYIHMLGGTTYARTESYPSFWGRYRFDRKNTLVRAGIRGDFHNLYGWLWSPDAKIKVGTQDTRIHLFGMRSYRVVNLSADHLHRMLSSRDIIRPFRLDIERGWRYGGSIEQHFSSGNFVGNVFAEFTRTDFGNQIVMDMDEQTDAISFYNLTGKAFVNEAIGRTSFSYGGFRFSAMYRYQDAQTTYRAGLRPTLFVSKHSGTASVFYRLSRTWNWYFELGAKLNGKQRLPDNDGGEWDTYSPLFATTNARITMARKQWRFYVGGENLLDYRQESPIVFKESLLGNEFEGSVVWGPVLGRRVYVGVGFDLD